MQLNAKMFLIVCPMLFIAGLVDAIGGGGGLISLPAYLFAGLPIHYSIATNKLSSTCGTSLATFRFIKHKLVDFKLAIPAVICAILGSSLGAQLSMRMSDRVMRNVMFIVLPVAAFFVLNKDLFKDRGGVVEENRRTFIVAAAAAFIIGIYDGFYGPGTGTFLIIALTVFAKMGITSANAQTKVINLTTNITSLTIFLLHGQVIIPLGIAAALCNMAGNYIGAGLAMNKGSKIVRPVILLDLGLLLFKIIAS